MARGLKLRIYEVEELYYVAKTKALISCAVAVFVFVYYCKKDCLMTLLICGAIYQKLLE